MSLEETDNAVGGKGKHLALVEKDRGFHGRESGELMEQPKQMHLEDCIGKSIRVVKWDFGQSLLILFDDGTVSRIIAESDEKDSGFLDSTPSHADLDARELLSLGLITHEECMQADKEARVRQQEERAATERAELARLQAKYGSAVQS